MTFEELIDKIADKKKAGIIIEGVKNNMDIIQSDNQNSCSNAMECQLSKDNIREISRIVKEDKMNKTSFYLSFCSFFIAFTTLLIGIDTLKNRVILCVAYVIAFLAYFVVLYIINRQYSNRSDAACMEIAALLLEQQKDGTKGSSDSLPGRG